MKTIKELRNENKVTPPGMANILGISLSSYFGKEAGQRKFKPNEIVVICKLFDVRVENIKDFCYKNTRKANKEVSPIEQISDFEIAVTSKEHP